MLSAAYSLKGTTMAGNKGLEAAPGAGTPPVRIDTSVAHIARVQDYWLGGRDNFAADRHAGDEAVAAFPGLVASARSARSFLARTCSTRWRRAASWSSRIRPTTSRPGSWRGWRPGSTS
jgi:hypothetical protein